MESIITILKIVFSFIWKNVLDIIFFLIAYYLVVSKQINKTVRPEVVFLNVGQGDSILVQQDNYQVLFDGGPDDSVIYELAKHMPLFDKKIEVLVLTHPHADHINGLMLVLQEYEVDKIIINKIDYDNKAYDYLLDKYSDKIVDVSVGDYITYRDLKFVVLFPFFYDYKEDKMQQENNINNESVATLLTIKNNKILLMGDAEKELEEKLLDYPIIRDIDVLKVGHHCSKTSSSEMFLKITNPKIAICSCAKKNNFGHPSSETLEKLKNVNAQVYLTFEEGNIVLRY